MSLKSKFKHSKVFILWFLNTDKPVQKTRLRLVFSTCLSVFRNQRKNTYSCLNYYINDCSNNNRIVYLKFKFYCRYKLITWQKLSVFTIFTGFACRTMKSSQCFTLICMEKVLNWFTIDKGSFDITSLIIYGVWLQLARSVCVPGIIVLSESSIGSELSFMLTRLFLQTNTRMVAPVSTLLLGVVLQLIFLYMNIL